MRYEMQYDSPQRPSPLSLTPWVRGLIMANAVIYLLMVTVLTGPWITDVGAFDPSSVVTRWWSFGSYMFLHGGFMHLVMNMLLLFIFGPAVEKRMGGTTFAAYYFICGVGGALTHLLIHLAVHQLQPMYGASAAVLGVALAFAMFWPNEPIHIFPLPMPIKVKWIVGFLVVVDLLAARSGAQDGIAHFAHLGGFLFGYVFLRTTANKPNRFQPAVSRDNQTKGPVRRRFKEPVGAVHHERNKQQSDESTDYDEIDRVLDKISETGLDSLTSDERRLLDEASRKLRKH